MSSNDTDHPLPELLDSVLNEDGERARAGGGEAKVDGTMVVLSTYDEPPESGGALFVRCRIPIDDRSLQPDTNRLGESQ